MRVCHIDQTEISDGAACASCMTRWPDLPDPKSMTGDERAAEMAALSGPLQVPFSLVHGRIEALVGRPVWTHEMGLSWDALVEESRTQPGDASPDRVMAALIASDKPVIVIPA